MSKIIGIDLGTTYSEMSVFENGQPKVLENSDGERTTPSVVAINKNGERMVGMLAKRQAIINPSNTIFSVKRLIGRKFTDATVQQDKKILPYEIREAENGGVEIKMADKWYKPEEISAMILQKIKADAEKYFGEPVNEAVITVPAYFDDSERQATKNAGEIAGLKVTRILNEPTAAALAYGFNKKSNSKLVIYDFGGGTLDVSVIEVMNDLKDESGVSKGGEEVTVLSTGGDSHLGGDDFDQRIIDWVITEFKKENSIDLSKDPLALQRIKEASEKAKRELSTSQESEINLPFIASDSANTPKHLVMKITRAKFEELTRDLVDRSIERLKGTLESASLNLKDIDDVILVGGTTRIPMIQQRIKDLTGKDPKKDINPDEVVSMGAAIVAGNSNGNSQGILLIDITPLTLSIETMGGVATPMVPKNTYIPFKHAQIFSTAENNQPSVEIHIVQGERPIATDNKTLGKFILDGIMPAPRGVPQVEVTFDIDSNGILNVTAIDKATSKSQSVRIEGSTGLSKEDIEKMKQDAEKFAEEDKKKKDLIEAQNQANNLVYTAEGAIKDAGDKIAPDLKEKLESKIKHLKEVSGQNNLEEIKLASEDLSTTLQEIGKAMYQQKEAPKTEEGKTSEGETKKEDSEPAAGETKA